MHALQINLYELISDTFTKQMQLLLDVVPTVYVPLVTGQSEGTTSSDTVAPDTLSLKKRQLEEKTYL